MISGFAENALPPMASMTMCTRAVWRRDLHTAEKILVAHTAANKMIFIDGSDIKLCNPVLFPADFTACKTQALAEPKPVLSKGRR